MSTKSDIIAEILSRVNIQKEKTLKERSQTYGQSAQNDQKNQFIWHVHEVEFLMRRCLFMWKVWKATKNPSKDAVSAKLTELSYFVRTVQL